MTTRQWFWRLSSRAPLSAWGLALLLPIVYGGWTLQSARSVDVDAVQHRIDEVTASVMDLRAQLQALEVGQTVTNSWIEASEDFLKLLLNYRCGVEQGFELSRQDERSKLVLKGDSLEALCALRVVQLQPGVVRQLRRNEDGRVNFTWEELPR